MSMRILRALRFPESHWSPECPVVSMIEAGFVAPWFTADFQEIKWKSFIDSDDERIALDATKYLTDRLYGKAAHSLDLTHSGEVAIRRVIADL